MLASPRSAGAARRPAEAARHAVRRSLRADRRGAVLDRGLQPLLTAIFLLFLLPLWDLRLPYTPALITLTFVAGLVPIVGNLLCNAVITMVGLSVSPLAAIACLIFLIVIHKAEYVINAKVVGSRTHMAVWELLAVMFVAEAVFGPAGLVAAPLFYAYLKKELQAEQLVSKPPRAQRRAPLPAPCFFDARRSRVAPMDFHVDTVQSLCYRIVDGVHKPAVATRPFCSPDSRRPHVLFQRVPFSSTARRRRPCPSTRACSAASSTS